MPCAWLSVYRGGEESRPVQTLIDTGSGYNILALELAEEMLGIPASELLKGKPLTAKGLKGESELFGWNMDLRLRRAQTATETLHFPGAMVYVSEKPPGGWPALLGQLDGLQQKWLRHHNHSNHRFWQLSESR